MQYAGFIFNRVKLEVVRASCCIILCNFSITQRTLEHVNTCTDAHTSGRMHTHMYSLSLSHTHMHMRTY